MFESRTSMSFGYGSKRVAELPEVPAVLSRAYRTHGRPWLVQKLTYPVPRVLWHGVYRAHRSSGTGMNVLQNYQQFDNGYDSLLELPEILGNVGHGRTELAEVPGTGMNVLQNKHMFRARA